MPKKAKILHDRNRTEEKILNYDAFFGRMTIFGPHAQIVECLSCTISLWQSGQIFFIKSINSRQSGIACTKTTAINYHFRYLYCTCFKIKVNTFL